MYLLYLSPVFFICEALRISNIPPTAIANTKNTAPTSPVSDNSSIKPIAPITPITVNTQPIIESDLDLSPIIADLSVANFLNNINKPTGQKMISQKIIQPHFVPLFSIIKTLLFLVDHTHYYLMT